MHGKSPFREKTGRWGWWLRGGYPTPATLCTQNSKITTITNNNNTITTNNSTRKTTTYNNNSNKCHHYHYHYHYHHTVRAT